MGPGCDGRPGWTAVRGAAPEAHLILEEISKLMLVEGDSRVALLRRELKRLRLFAREGREVRKRECPTEVGAVREIDEPGFHDRPEAECMFPVDEIGRASCRERV